jgi:hypothetical protein
MLVQYRGTRGGEGTGAADGVHQPVPARSTLRRGAAALLADDRVCWVGAGELGANGVLADRVRGRHQVDASLGGHLIGILTQIRDPLRDLGGSNRCLGFGSHVCSLAYLTSRSTCRHLTIDCLDIFAW